MTDTQYRIAFEEADPGEKPPRTLNLRLAGNGSAAIVASLYPQAVIHITGEANAARYAPGYVFGWLGKDDQTIYADSYEYNSSTDARLFLRSAFEAQGAPDVYGRQPGVVRGWVYLPYLEPVKETRFCPACGAVVDLTGEGRYAGHDTPDGVICEMSGEVPA